jgi:hypothetical protein
MAAFEKWKAVDPAAAEAAVATTPAPEGDELRHLRRMAGLDENGWHQ